MGEEGPTCREKEVLHSRGWIIFSGLAFSLASTSITGTKENKIAIRGRAIRKGNTSEGEMVEVDGIVGGKVWTDVVHKE